MKYLVATVCILFYLGLAAQDVKWGRPHQKPDKNLHISQVIGKTSGGIFTLLTDMRHPAILPPVLQRFDNDLKLEKQIPLRFQTDQSQLKLEKMLILEDHLYLLATMDGRVGGRIRVYYQEINQETLQPQHEPRLIQEINWAEGLFDVPLGVKISADRSKLLVYNFFPGTEENFGRNWLLTFDAQMKCFWSTTDKINQVEPDLLFLDYEITNKGEVTVLASEVKKGIHSTTMDPKLSVLKYPGKGLSMEKYDLNLGVVDLQQSDLQLDNAGHLICGGLLSNRYNETSGAFVSVVDEQTKEVRTNVHYFNDAELKSLDGEPKRLVDYQLRTIHVAANGSITLLSEQFLPPFRGNNQQFYGQVLLVRYAPDFSSCNLSSLNKSQVSFDRGYFDSFVYLAKGEQYLLLYNDKSKTPMRKAHFTSKGAENTPLEYPGTEKIKVRPSNCAALSNQELWIYAETVDKKHYQVGLLGF